MRLHATIAALALAASASTATAQACLGTPSFATSPIRLDASLTSGNDATTYAAGLSVGAARGPFAGASIGRTSFDEEFDEFDADATTVGLRGGWDVTLAPASPGARSFSLCPIVGFDFSNGEFERPGEDIDFSTRTFSLGLALGSRFAASPTLALVPFGAIAYNNSSLEIEDIDVDESEDYGTIDLGVGFVINRIFTIRPLVSIPVGLEDADPTFGVSLHLNFGGR
jgi:hypothetical protein